MEYLSDDENKEDDEKIMTFEEEYPEEEIDEETRALIFNSIRDDDIIIAKPKEKKENKKTQKADSTMSLKTFIEKPDPKNKKWQSKRVEGKKINGEVITKVVRRQFNPRLPPFKLVRKEYKEQEVLNMNDESMFPSIK